MAVAVAADCTPVWPTPMTRQPRIEPPSDGHGFALAADGDTGNQLLAFASTRDDFGNSRVLGRFLLNEPPAVEPFTVELDEATD